MPQPHNFHDGVLLMEPAVDAHGHAALGHKNLDFERKGRLAHHTALLMEVVRVLCAGVVRGNLPERHVLLGEDDLLVRSIKVLIFRSS